MITLAPFLQTFNPDYSKVVTNDASKYAVGGVLDQNLPEGRLSLDFISITLKPVEKNYDSYYSESLAIVEALRVWRCYIFGRVLLLILTMHLFFNFILKNDSRNCKSDGCRK